MILEMVLKGSNCLHVISDGFGSFFEIGPPQFSRKMHSLNYSRELRECTPLNFIAVERANKCSQIFQSGCSPTCSTECKCGTISKVPLNCRCAIPKPPIVDQRTRLETAGDQR